MTRRAGLSAAAVVAYCGVIFAMSSRRAPDVVVALGVADGWLHAVEYAILGALAADFAGARWGTVSWRGLVPGPTLFAALYGLTDELHQSLVPGRDALGSDLAWDVVGALLGASLYALARRWRLSGSAPAPGGSTR